jgi:hypothetical protein
MERVISGIFFKDLDEYGDVSAYIIQHYSGNSPFSDTRIWITFSFSGATISQGIVNPETGELVDCFVSQFYKQR